MNERKKEERKEKKTGEGKKRKEERKEKKRGKEEEKGEKESKLVRELFGLLPLERKRLIRILIHTPYIRTLVGGDQRWRSRSTRRT